ncbi:MAG: NAD(P)-dependent oxidoreductase [Gemmatimonadales bacterium]
MPGSPRLAFLGLGAIGRPMAVRVAGKYPLSVWNRTPGPATEIASRSGATAAASAREAVAGADVVMACLSTSADVEEVLFGPGGAAESIASGALVLDCTSGDAATSRRLAALLAQRNVGFADCPVSGGTNGAEAGALTVMVGADAGTFARARPFLETFGTLIVHVGPVGAGDTVKAINQVLLATHIASLGEALTAMVKAGVDARRGLEVINASSGRSFVSKALVPDRVLTGTWPNTFRLALLEKDVRIALGLVEELGLDAPVLEKVGEVMAAARRDLGESADYLEAIKLAEARAGVEVRG